MDDFQLKIEKNMTDFLKPKKYKKITNERIKYFYNLWFSQVKMHYSAIRDIFPLTKYKVTNGKLIDNDEMRKMYEVKNDNRYRDYYNLIDAAVKWGNENNLPKIKSASLYLWISDAYPYIIPDLEDYPIFLRSKPKNIKNPLIPENTFQCFQMDAKYTGKCYNWDDVKKIVCKECDSKNYDNKTPIVYFKGARTTRTRSKLRENLEIDSRSNKNVLKIILDAFQNYEPVYKMCNYRYLIDLPGQAPWSPRLKYLFLMKSPAIVVDYYVHGKDYFEIPYLSFINYAIDVEKYAEIIKYTYYRHDEKMQLEQRKQLLKNIIDIHKKMEQNPAFYKKRAESANKIMQKLTMDRVYNYIYNALLLLDKGK
jgi:hypothetical protein